MFTVVVYLIFISIIFNIYTMALKFPSMCWGVVKQLLTHSLI